MRKHTKKIGIFTICDALNYGAFYQMFGLYKYFEDLGYDVCIFSHSETISRLLLKYFSFNPKRQYRKTKLRHRFSIDENELVIKKYNGEHLDFAVLGSDELWNVQNNSFVSHDEYFGIGVNASYIFSYAPSIGFCDPKVILRDSRIRRGLERLNLYSARDIRTLTMLEKVTNQGVELVADPTILYSSWEKHIKEFNYSEKYVLYYGYDSNPPFKNELLNFARENSLKVFSSGFKVHDWCDENFLLSPFEFLGMLKNSSGFFTSTFHGTVMSALLNVPFIYYSEGQKVLDFGKRFELINRLWSREIEDFKEILSCKNFKKTNIHLSDFKKSSRSYIQNALNDSTHG